jgi:dTDP-4-amino-4,6-dideoxygalactose transaminase
MDTKQSLDSLAIFGAAPAFTDKLHVGRPNIGDHARFMERINDILDSKWLTNAGPYVQEFERRIADLTQVKHCIAMCNATVALEILIRALDLSGEVIVPSFTFVATANALQWQGITPVFCDLDPRTHTLDPNQVEQMITPRTTGIMGVHLWGHACEVETLTEIAGRRGLKLIFDSAHAFGCSYQGRMIGAFGDAEVFSFHATKLINSLEGGAVVTNDDDLARKIRLMKNFGFTSFDQTSYIGINGKMNEVSAAMGLTNLESLDDFIAVNRRNYEMYARQLAGLEGIALLPYPQVAKWNYQYVVLDIDECKTIVTRDELIEILHWENVLARRYFYPGCHRMEPYRSSFPEAGLRLPETERLANRVLCLPTGTAVEERHISIISRILRLVLQDRAEIKRRLRREAPRCNSPDR